MRRLQSELVSAALLTLDMITAMVMVLPRFAPTVTTGIIRMLALPTATMGLTGLSAGSSSVLVPGSVAATGVAATTDEATTAVGIGAVAVTGAADATTAGRSTVAMARAESMAEARSVIPAVTLAADFMAVAQAASTAEQAVGSMVADSTAAVVITKS